MAEASDEYRDLARRLTEEAADGADVNNTTPARSREQIEQQHGQVWDSFTLARDFDIESFAPGHGKVNVIRRADGKRGTVEYQHEPRFYWGFI